MPFFSIGLWRDLVNARELKIAATLPVRFFAHNESGQSVGGTDGAERSVEESISVSRNGIDKSCQ